MPIITPQSNQGRSAVTADTQGSWIAPKKTIQAEPTGVEYKPAGQPEKSSSEETPTPPPKETTLSPQLTALARKEQALRKQELAIKAEREAVEKQRQEFGKLSELKTKLEAKDYSILDELGLKYDEYVEYVINKSGQTDPRDAKIKELEARLNSFDSKQQENVSKQYDATIGQYKKDIAKQIDLNPDFESIKVIGANEHVLQHILDTFNEENEILTVEEACRDVKEALAEEAELFSKAFKPKEVKTEEQKILPPPQQRKTLTNQIPQAEPTQPRNQFQHMSPKERLAAAIAKAQRK